MNNKNSLLDKTINIDELYTPRVEIDDINDYITESNSPEELKNQIQEINASIERLRFVESRIRQERDAWKNKIEKNQSPRLSNVSESILYQNQPKSTFDLVQCGAVDGTQTSIRNGTHITMSHKSYTDVRMFWSNKPQTCLIIQKARQTTTYEFVEMVGEYLINNGIEVYVEQHVFNDLNRTDFKTYDENCNLSDLVDFAVTIGGDSTLCYFSSLFPGQCPPVLSFSISICGFLTPYSIKDYEIAFNYVFLLNYIDYK